jgi:hypothetical protein
MQFFSQKKAIARTRFLYTNKTLDKTNIHQYLVGKNNICMVVELENGIFLAGFYPYIWKTREHGDDPQGGLLISMTTNSSYELKENRNDRGMSYDAFFIIFGNSELRYKNQENKIFSNFGTSNAYFDNRGDTGYYFLYGQPRAPKNQISSTGSENITREINIRNVEFYQIEFNDNQ